MGSDAFKCAQKSKGMHFAYEAFNIDPPAGPQHTYNVSHFNWLANCSTGQQVGKPHVRSADDTLKVHALIPGTLYLIYTIETSDEYMWILTKRRYGPAAACKEPLIVTE
eukprot:1401833-Pyramimonas_sp.AAC.1